MKGVKFDTESVAAMRKRLQQERRAQFEESLSMKKVNDVDIEGIVRQTQMTKSLEYDGIDYWLGILRGILCCSRIPKTQPKFATKTYTMLLKSNQHRVKKMLDIVPLLKQIRTLKFFFTSFLSDRQKLLL